MIVKYAPGKMYCVTVHQGGLERPVLKVVILYLHRWRGVMQGANHRLHDARFGAREMGIWASYLCMDQHKTRRTERLSSNYKLSS